MDKDKGFTKNIDVAVVHLNKLHLIRIIE